MEAAVLLRHRSSRSLLLHEQVERSDEIKKLADVIETLKKDLERIPGYVKPEPKVVTGTLPDPS